MAKQRSFGRRIDPQRQSRQSKSEPALSKAGEATPARGDILSSSPIDIAASSLDDELEAWIKARKKGVPWRQVSLMASLCFGIASFVLPASVNDSVQWFLYALAAMSFCAGAAKRRQAGR